LKATIGKSFQEQKMARHAFVVEENSLIRQSVCEMLSLAGYMPMVPGDLHEAAKVLGSIQFDLLFVGAGHRLTYNQTLANMAKRLQPSMKIIAARPGERAQAAFDGAHAYVRVPITLQELREALAKLSLTAANLPALPDSPAK
jgi:DNA-binding NtrC family response regulator